MDNTSKKRKNYNFKIGCVITVAMLLFVLVGIIWTPYPPEAVDASAKLAGSSLAHPFGCDQLGRDILSRVMSGRSHCLRRQGQCFSAAVSVF